MMRVTIDVLDGDGGTRVAQFDIVNKGKTIGPKTTCIYQWREVHDNATNSVLHRREDGAIRLTERVLASYRETT